MGTLNYQTKSKRKYFDLLQLESESDKKEPDKNCLETVSCDGDNEYGPDLCDSDDHSVSDSKHSCEICSKSFKTAGGVKQHLSSVHCSDRTFKCSSRGCEGTFKTRGNLKRHMQLCKNFLIKKKFKRRSHEKLDELYNEVLEEEGDFRSGRRSVDHYQDMLEEVLSSTPPEEFGVSQAPVTNEISIDSSKMLKSGFKRKKDEADTPECSLSKRKVEKKTINFDLQIPELTECDVCQHNKLSTRDPKNPYVSVDEKTNSKPCNVGMHRGNKRGSLGWQVDREGKSLEELSDIDDNFIPHSGLKCICSRRKRVKLYNAKVLDIMYVKHDKYKREMENQTTKAQEEKEENLNELLTDSDCDDVDSVHLNKSSYSFSPSPSSSINENETENLEEIGNQEPHTINNESQPTVLHMPMLDFM